MPADKQNKQNASEDVSLTPEEAGAHVFDLLGTDPEFAGEVEEREREEADEASRQEDADVLEDPDDDSDLDAEPEDDDEEEADEGEEEDGEEEDDADDPSTTLHTVKVDGEEYEVTLEEALRGYQRTQAFTKKTMALAEERRAWEAEQQAEQAKVQQSQQEYAARIQAADQILRDLQKVDATDPEKRRKQLEAVQAERARLQQEQQAQYQAQMERHIQQEAEKLHAQVPEWVDDDVALKEKQRMATYAQEELGFTPEQLSTVSDHRLFLILRKAMLYDGLEDRKADVRRKAKKSPSLTPGSKESGKGQKKRQSKARSRLRQSGNTKDAQAAILDLLGDE